MSDEMSPKRVIETIERGLSTWEEGEGYHGGYDFDAERGLVNDVRTLLEIAKAAVDNITIDVHGPGGVIQQYTLSGAVAVEPADTVRIEAVTPRPARTRAVSVDTPSEFVLMTVGTVRISTDQPYTVKILPPAKGDIREYR